VGDAERLEFPAASFDRVLINFGVLHFPRPERALAEARRVLRAGGRLGFSVWAGPELSPGARAVDDAVAAHAESPADLPAGPPLADFVDGELCGAALARLGFDPDSLRFTTRVGRWRVPSADFLFEAERRGGVRTAALLARQSPERIAAIRVAIAAALAPFAAEGGYVLPMAAHLAAITMRAWCVLEAPSDQRVRVPPR
jgi:SAM-dependent methyltransferase